MTRVSRDVDLTEVDDLLERVPRACLAFAGEDGPEAIPVELVWRDGRYLAGSSATSRARPSVGQECVVLVDEGVHWFDLRAVYVRGRAQPVPAPQWARPGRTWFEVEPTKIVAWDYGKLRAVSDDG
jgi:nitroimidazol reductase NimA-like FMN-containing flavoprotein (pyridoxamine 5'-phosphate oxidase superfamily)